MEEDVALVGIVEYYHPFPLLLITQPTKDKPHDVCTWLISTMELDRIGNPSVVFPESGWIAGMDPEHPGLRRPFSDEICIFNGKLRLSSIALKDVLCFRQRILTQRLPVRIGLSVRLAIDISYQSGRVSLLD